jgi:hypothetical protein
MIRFLLGLLFVLGAVGSVETDPSASLFYYSVVAVMGLSLMYWPVSDGTFKEYK